MRKTLFSLFLLFTLCELTAQEILLPLEVNPFQAEAYQQSLEQGNDKLIRNEEIKVDLNNSLIIMIDDFSTNKGSLGSNYWLDDNVYINNNFAKNPSSIGVVTFDGMDETGYPYDFTQPSSYGACDTLTSLPIQLGKVNYSDPDTVVYFSFLYQPTGISPFPNSEKDSIALEFKEKREKMIIEKIYFSDSITGLTDTVLISRIVDDSRWDLVWSKKGGDVNKSSPFFDKAIIKLDSIYFKNGFQFRFVNYGNTSGSVDHWHLDNIFMSVGSLASHENFEDVAFRTEPGSQLKEYSAMPWKHYYDNPSFYVDTSRFFLRMSSTYNSSVNVTLEYFAEDANGNQIDNISGVPGGVILFGKSFKSETMPITGVSTHFFQFPVSSEPDKNATTYFLKRSVMTNPDQNEIIKENNVVKDYQVFGTYYSYDDGSAEAGYGLRASGGKIAYQFNLRDGLVDTIRSIYIYFNPVVVSRANERFKFTVWDDNNGRPGNIIYQDNTIHSPSYPKDGINSFQRIELDGPAVVSDVYYIGYEKLTAEVLNIGYDLNDTIGSSKLFYNTGTGWFNSGVSQSVQKGSLMMRPSFSDADEPIVGLKKVRNEINREVRLFPNPANDVIYITSEDHMDHLMLVRLFDLRGTLMRSFEMKHQAQIDVKSLNPGMYIIQCSDISGVWMKSLKFIVSE